MVVKVLNDDNSFTEEFKLYIQKLIENEMKQVTTDGKIDKEKAIKYIKEHQGEVDHDS